MSRIRIGWVCALLCGAAAVATAAEPARAQNGFARFQTEQAWATAKINASPRHHEWVTVRLGDRTLHAFVTRPEQAGRRPVVLVMHEVFGLTDSTLNTADQIAALGYVTVAPDMLSGLAPDGGGTSAVVPPLEAGNLMTSFPSEYANAQFDAWAQYAAGLPQSDGTFAIVGLSWGGGAAFRYAASSHASGLRSVSVFYDVGPPTVTQGPGRSDPSSPPLSVTGIDVPVYHFIPSLDARVVRSIDATRLAMAAAGKRYEQILVEGADHAYMRLGEDPHNDNPLNRAAVQSSLARLKEILASH